MVVYPITNEKGQTIRLVNLSGCLDISIGNKVVGEFPIRAILANGETVVLETFKTVEEASKFLNDLYKRFM